MSFTERIISFLFFISAIFAFAYIGNLASINIQKDMSCMKSCAPNLSKRIEKICYCSVSGKWAAKTDK